MHRRLVALLLITVLAAGIAGAAPGVAQSGGAVSVKLLDAPTNRRDDPRARIYIVDHLHPGDRIERHVEVANSTPQTLDISLYEAAANVVGGEMKFGDGHARNELTGWTTVTPSTVTLPSGGKATATVVIAVPAGAADGERYGVVWAELPPSGGQVSGVNRVGIRIYLSVGEGEEPKTDFTIDALTAQRDAEGVPLVRTTVTNTGGRAIDLSGKLWLKNGPGSLSAGPFNVELGTTLAPGKKAPALVRLDKGLPDGPWDATVEIRSGELSKKAEGQITFPNQAGVVARTVKAEPVDGGRKVLGPVAGLLAGAVLLALFLLWRRRRTEERQA